MDSIFIDSSALFAWGDRSSEEGEQVQSFVKKRQSSLVTTNLIFSETISLITKRVGKFKGIEVGEMMRSSSVFKTIFLDEKILEEAWQMYKKYKDKDFDFIDATSFIFCQKRGIKEVITFDHHFSQMGFKVVP